VIVTLVAIVLTVVIMIVFSFMLLHGQNVGGKFVRRFVIIFLGKRLCV